MQPVPGVHGLGGLQQAGQGAIRDRGLGQQVRRSVRYRRLGVQRRGRRHDRPQQHGHRAERRQVDDGVLVLHGHRAEVLLLEQVGQLGGGDASAQRDPCPGWPSLRLAQPDGQPVRRGGQPGTPAGQRVPVRFQCAQQYGRMIDADQADPGGQRRRGAAALAGDQVVVVLRGGGAEARVPPVSLARGQRVLVGVAPVLPGEAAAVRGGAPVAVDPHPGRPRAARPHQRQVQRAVRADGTSGGAPVEQGHRTIRQRRVAVGHLVRDVGGAHLDHGVGQIRGDAGDGCGQPARAAAGHDQHRQVRRAPQVRAGHERFRAGPGRGQPQPGGAPRLQPGAELLGVGRAGRAEGGGA